MRHYSLMENVRSRQRRKRLRILAFVFAEAAAFFAGFAIGSFIYI